ncbi:MAG: C1 family peptidase [Dyadobacter fermentans]
MKNTIKCIVTLCLLNLFLASCKDKESTGLLVPSIESIRKIKFDDPIVEASILELRPVDLLRFFPPAASQGIQGSCAPFSVAYSLMSYYEKVMGNYGYFDATGNLDSRKVFSPSFIYSSLNKETGDCSSGVDFFDTFKFIEENGSCSWHDYPYNGKVVACPKPPSTSLIDKAKSFRGYDFRRFEVNSQNIEHYLRRGIPLIVGIYTSENMLESGLNWNGNDYPWNPSAIDIDEYHSMLVIGYDQQNYKLLNSWGSNWGFKGSCVIRKDIFLKRVREVYMAYNNRNIATNIFRPRSSPEFLPRNRKRLDSLEINYNKRLDSLFNLDLNLLKDGRGNEINHQVIIKQIISRIQRIDK